MKAIDGMLAAKNIVEFLTWAADSQLNVKVVTVDGVQISGQVVQFTSEFAILSADKPLEAGSHWFGNVVMLAHITRIELHVQEPIVS
jgi:hypothetical protein